MVIKPHTKKERDAQRARVYKADAALKPFDRRDLSTVFRMEKYVDLVWADDRVQAAFPEALRYKPPQVRDGRGRRHAAATERKVMMPRWARCESTLIHELAHVIHRRTYGPLPAGHGWQYCEVYLKLAQIMMGHPAAHALTAAFRKHRVRYRGPRKVAPLTPERRAALVARLAEARRQAALIREANARWAAKTRP